MLAGQKLVASDGYEVCLFPFEYLYMSQDEGGNFSHQNTYNIDFIGWGANGRILKCPFYAPVTLQCVNTKWDPKSHNVVYTSTKKVHFADGTLDYLTIAFAHDDKVPYQVGDIIPQGNVLGHTGTTGNVTGDHTHSCCAKGLYRGMVQRPGGAWDLVGRVHYWDATYVNDTVIVRGYKHDWRVYDGSVIPPIPTPTIKKGKFPWVLYARKLRFIRV